MQVARGGTGRLAGRRTSPRPRPRRGEASGHREGEEDELRRATAARLRAAQMLETVAAHQPPEDKAEAWSLEEAALGLERLVEETMFRRVALLEGVFTRARLPEA